MLISVIVPVYNVEPYLRRCLDSLLAQTVFAQMEIILVDDGSFDGSAEICNIYASCYDNISVVHQINMGLSGARNSGIERARGKYIGYVDSDDYVLPDMFEILLKNAEKCGADISCCGFIKKKRNGIVSGHRRTNRFYCWDREEAIAEYLEQRKLGLGACDKIFRYQSVADLRFPAGRIHEDILYVAEAILSVAKVCYEDTGKYVYEIRENSITTCTTYTARKIEDRLFVIGRLKELVLYQFPQMAGLVECNAAYHKYKILEKIDASRISKREFGMMRKQLYDEIRNVNMSMAKVYLARRHYLALWLMRRCPIVYLSMARLLEI